MTSQIINRFYSLSKNYLKLEPQQLQMVLHNQIRCSGQTKSANKLVPGIHEPKYLADLKPNIGFFELLNLQLKGYDYVVLEKYQSYLHKTLKKLNVRVVKTWSAPHQELQFEILGDRSSALETSYNIKIYERNIQMKDALVTQVPILIDIINATSPPGVSFNIDRQSQDDETRLYIKDSVLENMKKELQELKDTPLIGL